MKRLTLFFVLFFTCQTDLMAQFDRLNDRFITRSEVIAQNGMVAPAGGAGGIADSEAGWQCN